MSAPDDWPTAELPGRTDRPLRLGPFPSAREAVKFGVYATFGAIVAAFAGPLGAVPFVGAGWIVSVHGRSGRGPDAVLGEYVRYRWRRGGRKGGLARAVPASASSSAVVPLRDGTVAGALSVNGVPISFLPPSDARRTFEAYREMLRQAGPGWHFRVTSVPLGIGEMLPTGAPRGAEEEVARQGYAEMVRLLGRRRRTRRVDLLAWAPAGPDGAANLDSRLTVAADRLRALGLEVDRLVGRPLSDVVSALDGTGGPRG